MSALLPTILEIQNAEIYKNVQPLNKYHMPQYYWINMFKVLLSESKVNASLYTFCHPCYCHPCYQPKVTGMTSGNRDDTNMFSSVIWIVVKIRNCYYIFQNKNCDSTRKRNAVICECVSSLLPLAGNRDDIKYENSHLLCCLEAKI